MPYERPAAVVEEEDDEDEELDRSWHEREHGLVGSGHQGTEKCSEVLDRRSSL